MSEKLLSIIVPVYNEKNTVGAVLKKLKALDVDKEIIVVDDHSTDGTYETLKALCDGDKSIKLIRHQTNSGKGKGIADGFRAYFGAVVEGAKSYAV